MKPTDLITVVIGIIALVLGTLPTFASVEKFLIPTGVGLIAFGLPQTSKWLSGKVIDTSAKVLLLAGLCFSTVSCHGITPTQFGQVAIDCVNQDPVARAALLASIEDCTRNVIAGNYEKCIVDAEIDGKFAFGEVACVVAYLNQQKPTAQPAAGRWLATRRVQVKSTP
jgi:hypothetical protein